jgi:hypothetical protein
MPRVSCLFSDLTGEKTSKVGRKGKTAAEQKNLVDMFSPAVLFLYVVDNNRSTLSLLIDYSSTYVRNYSSLFLSQFNVKHNSVKHIYSY